MRRLALRGCSASSVRHKPSVFTRHRLRRAIPLPKITVPAPRVATEDGCRLGSLGLVLQYVRVRRQSVIFVEVFRLLLVIAGTIGGLTVGNEIGRNTTAPGRGHHPGRAGLVPPRRDRRAAHRPRPARRGVLAPHHAGELGLRGVGGGDDGTAPRARGRPPRGGPRPLEHRLPARRRLRLGPVRGGGPHRGGQGPGDRAGGGDVPSPRPARRAAAGHAPCWWTARR